MLELKDKKVLIAGLGLSGKAVLEKLSSEGAQIAVYDLKDIEWDDPRLFKKLEITQIPAFLNGIEVPDEDWDYVVLSPGIPMDTQFVKNARKRGSRIMGELELAYELGHGKYIAITGTNGKTTTTTLVGKIFSNAGEKNIVGGNIGTPVISSIDDSDDSTFLVTEVSSFQLESVIDFKPNISAILNLTPDHMDRHKNMENYSATKARIFENQDMDDYLIYNYDDEAVCKMVQTAKCNKIPFSRKHELDMGAFVKNGKIVIRDQNGVTEQLIDADELTIQGPHNLENALAAAAIAYFAGIKPHVIGRTIKDFDGVSHRLELVTTKRGIKFVNDSKGTNTDASMRAIDAIGKGIFLIAGGFEKNSDFKEFIRSFDGRVKHLLLIGETAERIKADAEELGFTDITLCADMGACVRAGYEYAQEGDTVLLSPASASWDMYKNFEERGDHFRKVVEELK